ncbi:hypothetical protein J7M22_02845 [Candidatus Poribacteria bacterium]|nr:hypothetical protein [Candidatus Poribacteria bacterium]
MRLSRIELEERLRAEGFRYLGSYIASDCSILNWIRPIEDGQFEVASADGWLGNWTPHVRKLDMERLYRLIERILAERSSLWRSISRKEIQERCDLFLKRVLEAV